LERVLLNFYGLYRETWIPAFLLGLDDELAMANPVAVRQHQRMCMAKVETSKLAVHFYDNRGTGIANVLAAYESGVSVFESSLGGACVNSCFKTAIPGGTLGRSEPHGLATEDLLYALEEMGIPKEIDIDRLIQCGRMLARLPGVQLHSRIRSSGLSGKTLGGAKINFVHHQGPITRLNFTDAKSE
jgi:hydroxymethylglutaryl-CoA lyase